MKISKVNLYEYFNIEKRSGRGTLTIYEPGISVEINLERKFPAMLIVHGGGYRGESFRESEPISLEFLTRGYVSFELDYDLEPFSYENSPLIEGALAMKYIRQNRERYHLTDKVGVIGFSAGGHLASYLSSAYDGELFREYFNGDTSGIRPDGAIMSYGVLTSDYITASRTVLRLCGYNEEKVEKLSPERYVTKDSSPAYIWATRDDECVNCMHSLLLASAYAKAGANFSLHIYPKGQHGLSTGDIRVYKKGYDFRHCVGIENWLDEACEFLKEQGFEIKD